MSGFSSRITGHSPWCELLQCRQAGPSRLGPTIPRLARRPLASSSRLAASLDTHTSIPSHRRSFQSTSRRLVPPDRRPDSTTTTVSPSTLQVPAKPTGPKSLDPDKATSTSSQTQSAADWRIIRQLATNIWPKGSSSTKVRVVGALGLLVAGKVLNVQVPFFFKDVVDSLNVPITAESSVWILAGASIAGCTSFFTIHRWSRKSQSDGMTVRIMEGCGQVYESKYWREGC